MVHEMHSDSKTVVRWVQGGDGITSGSSEPFLVCSADRQMIDRCLGVFLSKMFAHITVSESGQVEESRDS